MGHTTRIQGTSYAVTGGRCAVGGTAYALRRGSVRVAGTVREISFSPYDPVFSNNSWTAIIEACRTGAVPDSWAADGSSHKTMTIGGLDYRVDIIGRYHDVYDEDKSPAPLTLQLHDLYARRLTTDNADPSFDGCPYRRSTLHTETFDQILEEMPAEVRAAVRKISRYTRNCVNDIVNYYTPGKLFLLSELAVYGKNTYGLSGRDEAQYAYYTIPEHRKKTDLAGQPASWWTCDSTFTTAENQAGLGYTWTGVDESGQPVICDVRQPGGICFAFCF